jgi:type IV pilus secretin PilQ/predicted competence protein
MNARLSLMLVAGCSILAAAPAAPAAVLVASSGAPTVKAAQLMGSAADATQIRLSVPGLNGQPHVEVLTSPDRVVIDLPGVIRGSSVSRKDLAALSHPLILKVRMAQFVESPAPITRMVLEVPKGTQVSVRSDADGLSLDLKSGQGAVQARFEQGAPAMVAPVSAAPSAPVKVEQEVVTAQAAPAPAAPVQPLSSLPATGGTMTTLPQLATATLMPAAAPEMLPVQDVKPAPAPAASQAPRPSRTIGENGPRYSGTKMTIDLQNTDLVSFLRIIAETGKLNLVVDSDVQGMATFKFVDTPWDQVLDVVLKNMGLGQEIQNGVLRVAKIEKLQKEEEDRKKLLEAKALAGDLQTITRPLSYAKVADVSKILKDLLTKRGSVILDDRTNTLIVTDLPRNISVIDELIQGLDVQIQQVQIEARVVEATKGWERDFGVKWPQANGGASNLKVDDGKGGTTDAPWISHPSGYAWNDANIYSSGSKSLATGFAGGREGVTSLTNPAGEFWFSFLSNKLNINVILQALEKDSIVKVVSNPKVVTQNNRKAQILSGEKIPYPAQQGGAAGGAITVQFVEANLQMDVTPQITSEGTIIMDLHVEKSEADFSRTVLGSPTIKRKSLETQILVRDGGTAVLGGVYTNSTSVGTTGVPFLSKIPILGYLFKTKTNSEANAELIIFITPRIVRQ